MRSLLLVLTLLFFAVVSAWSWQHDHPVPEKLGSVDFPVACIPAVQPRFNRGVALLHSFSYEESAKAFQSVLAEDPHCAMAHWGVAMSYYHPLWDVLDAGREEKGKTEMAAAATMGSRSPREKELIAALARFYRNPDQQSLRDRMITYERDMSQVAAHYPTDVESQIFYALALLSTAPPTDRTHANQKKAVAILEPLYEKYPQHPGLAHYLIHAYDNSEMASRGVKVARDYSQIAPSAPHALHMPSHIFTREGMWSDSVQSNQAARKAAREHRDIGEELHAMDYLTYAYLQMGDDERAQAVLKDLSQLTGLSVGAFKIGYAATAMPVRYAVERKNWTESSTIKIPNDAQPEVAAVSVWARAIGLARAGNPTAAKLDVQRLTEIERKLRAAGNTYWADQVSIQAQEANGWVMQASGDSQAARRALASAADLEDSMEKLPLTPGPVIPAREQLGELLLQMRQPSEALNQFERSLQESPGRRNALQGALQAAKQADMPDKVAKYQTAVKQLSGQ